uniref:GIY-YIG endonuclease n=1 Tax=Cordyceps militaris TaxID=73501 RepID=A0A0G3Y645_CORMI|nr:hypothetical protein [Cordyceps militaris]AKM22587.1 hypothetical protein [Cordyceps militaris]AKM22598.1 hypothetical protein [Cordyceps militaris]AKM22609.1 GIY-YIG endonuclease [Cordyceps militaris]WLN31622.1 hypothetical protein [Cordyceps militaris]
MTIWIKYKLTMRKIIPIKIYNNAFINKNKIFLDNKNQSGIYKWINNINGNTYVGSGLNLTKRVGDYFKESELKRNLRPIHAALLKYGHDNFTLEILEYCKPDELIKKEQYYLDLIKPEYNILKNAYSLLGFKHSDETIARLKLKSISEEHKKILSSAHLGKEVSQEVRDKLSLAMTNYKKNNPLSTEALANIKAKTTEREGKPVRLLNIKTNETLDFSTLTEAGKYLGIKRQAVRNAINRRSIVKNQYRVSEL